MKPTAQGQPGLDEFYEFFKTVNSNNENVETPINDEFDYMSIDDTELNSPITGSEILKCISNLKNSKAPSQIDNILNEYIKNSEDLILPIYVFLFSAILDTGYMPESWLIGSVTPIYKGKGSPSDPGYYRPITILSCLHCNIKSTHN